MPQKRLNQELVHNAANYVRCPAPSSDSDMSRRLTNCRIIIIIISRTLFRKCKLWKTTSKMLTTFSHIRRSIKSRSK